MKFDVLTLGNAVVDLLVTIDDTNPSFTLDENTHELRIKAGEKILAEHVGFAVGGSACRVSISLSRLGFTTGVISEIGNDELSTRIKKTLQEEHVDTSFLRQTNSITAFTVGLNYKKERTLFVHLQEGIHDLSLEGLQTSWVYVGALGSPWEKAYENVISYKKETNCHIAFSPGQPQFLQGRESFSPMLKSSDIIFVNKQEAQTIVGSKQEEMHSLLRLLHDLGPIVVVITDGRNGAYAFDNETSYQIPILQTDVVERTGTGDAFAAGFLAAYMRGNNVSEALLAGTVNASSVVGKLGGLAGLLRKDEFKEVLNRASLPQARRL